MQGTHHETKRPQKASGRSLTMPTPPSAPDTSKRAAAHAHSQAKGRCCARNAGSTPPGRTASVGTRSLARTNSPHSTPAKPYVGVKNRSSQRVATKPRKMETLVSTALPAATTRMKSARRGGSRRPSTRWAVHARTPMSQRSFRRELSVKEAVSTVLLSLEDDIRVLCVRGESGASEPIESVGVNECSGISAETNASQSRFLDPHVHTAQEH